MKGNEMKIRPAVSIASAGAILIATALALMTRSGQRADGVDDYRDIPAITSNQQIGHIRPPSPIPRLGRRSQLIRSERPESEDEILRREVENAKPKLDELPDILVPFRDDIAAHMELEARLAPSAVRVFLFEDVFGDVEEDVKKIEEMEKNPDHRIDEFLKQREARLFEALLPSESNKKASAEITRSEAELKTKLGTKERYDAYLVWKLHGFPLPEIAVQHPDHR